MDFKKGDYVTRFSYNSDVIFKIEKIEDGKAILRGSRLRLLADAPLDDLKKYDTSQKEIKKDLQLESLRCLKRRRRNLILNKTRCNNSNGAENKFRKQVGEVLHIDGDRDYLQLSLQNYENLLIPARGFFVPEKVQPVKIRSFLESFNPDILVITGHDGVTGNDFNTADYFIKTVKIARDYVPDLDQLIIFAGACYSPYKKLIQEGANFASSPRNQLLHFLDPVLVVEKVAYTSIRKVVSVKDILKTLITEKGVGGIETRGKMRRCYP
ncbi:MAG: sporulation peptidase YabG [Halanaerobiaceae bacterium]